MKSNLTVKPWAPKNDDTAETETVVSRDSQSTGSDDDVEKQGVVKADDDSHHCKDGSVCAVCKEEYQAGEPVYESNNPQCGHEHHKKCMDKWLQFQNSCPTCNQPFSLKVV